MTKDEDVTKRRDVPKQSAPIMTSLCLCCCEESYNYFDYYDYDYYDGVLCLAILFTESNIHSPFVGFVAVVNVSVQWTEQTPEAILRVLPGGHTA